jgi:hypothetical protein
VTYSEKLQDPRWQKRRAEILERDRSTCTLCQKTDGEMHVDHLWYEGQPWEAPDEALRTVCAQCHWDVSPKQRAQRKELLRQVYTAFDAHELTELLRQVYTAFDAHELTELFHFVETFRHLKFIEDTTSDTKNYIPVMVGPKEIAEVIRDRDAQFFLFFVYMHQSLGGGRFLDVAEEALADTRDTMIERQQKARTA